MKKQKIAKLLEQFNNQIENS